jgi:hypothetical protein
VVRTILPRTSVPLCSPPDERGECPRASVMFATRPEQHSTPRTVSAPRFVSTQPVVLTASPRRPVASRTQTPVRVWAPSHARRSARLMVRACVFYRMAAAREAGPTLLPARGVSMRGGLRQPQHWAAQLPTPRISMKRIFAEEHSLTQGGRSFTNALTGTLIRKATAVRRSAQAMFSRRSRARFDYWLGAFTVDPKRARR